MATTSTAADREEAMEASKVDTRVEAKDVTMAAEKKRNMAVDNRVEVMDSKEVAMEEKSEDMADKMTMDMVAEVVVTRVEVTEEEAVAEVVMVASRVVGAMEVEVEVALPANSRAAATAKKSISIAVERTTTNMEAVRVLVTVNREVAAAATAVRALAMGNKEAEVADMTMFSPAEDQAPEASQEASIRNRLPAMLLSMVGVEAVTRACSAMQ